jgi:hypothetical protein
MPDGRPDPAQPGTFLIETGIGIEAPAQRVWDVLTDFAGYARWNPVLIDVEGPLVPGAGLRLKTVHSPGFAPTDGRVTLVEARFPEMRWEGGHPDPFVLKGVRIFRCDADGHVCRFRQAERFSGASAERLLMDYGARIEANFRRFNEALKRAAEGSQAPSR